MNEPTVERRGTVHYAGIRIAVTFAEWGSANALVAEVYGWLAQRGTVPGGGPVYRYRTVGDAERPFDLEVGVPVAEAVEGDGRVHAGSLPAGTYAVLLHEGHPDGLGKAHAALQEWAGEMGLELDRDGEVWAARYETYLTDPAQEPDLAKWRTELAYLVKEA
ncbi:GyrI-like domain-containing protein [Actinomadura sp. WMMB 499]|uniref:GyrI-like domain-containing protein n=1 Tax=Actinomadura sp. WMMB 499 TaxID=1219491 RepID=UPI0012446306|nr:GyrI-like domain-containing protein [Actinomadura sp. WMMB 499]QFG25070.1 GyrI-like domain-containing protein [Actinomadura sp. WMMB 499]